MYSVRVSVYLFVFIFMNIKPRFGPADGGGGARRSPPPPAVCAAGRK